MFPGREYISPASMALQRVEIAGEKSITWKKAMCAARCGSGHRALAAWDGAIPNDEFIVACGSEACKQLFILAA